MARRGVNKLGGAQARAHRQAHYPSVKRGAVAFTHKLRRSVRERLTRNNEISERRSPS